MKITKLFPIVLSVLFTFAACSDDIDGTGNGDDGGNGNGNGDGEDEITLSVSPQGEVTFPPVGETVVFTVDTNSTSWKATLSEEGHFRVVESSDTFIVIAEPNHEQEDRKATVTVTATGTDETVTISLVQGFTPIVYYFNITPEEDQLFGFAGGEKRFAVDTNVKDWAARLSDDSWFDINTMATSIVVEAPQNTSPVNEYKADLLITGTGMDPVTIKISQESLAGLKPWRGMYYVWAIDTDDKRVEFEGDKNGLWKYFENDETYGEHMLLLLGYENLCLKYQSGGTMEFYFDLSYTLTSDDVTFYTFVPLIIDDQGNKVIIDRSAGVPYSQLFVDKVNLSFSTGDFTYRHDDGKDYPVYYGQYVNVGEYYSVWMDIYKKIHWELEEFIE